MNPQKILEIKRNDWMKGISAQDGFPLGGIFSAASPFHPFHLAGYFRASVEPETVDNTTLSTQVKAMKAAARGTGYIFAIGDRAGTGTKCFYRISTADNSVMDYSSAVATNVPAGAVILGGLIIDADGQQVIYAEMNNGNIRRVSFSGTGDANIETMGPYNSAYPVVFFIGAEGYYYNTTGMSTGVVNEFHGSGSSWVTSGAGYTIRVGMVAKDGCNDGRYTIIVGDTNPDNVSNISSECGVFFFLPGAPTWTHWWPIPDKYILAVHQVGGRIYIIGASGIWETSIGMAPQLVMPLSASQLPLNALAVDTMENILYWAANSVLSRVWAFGNPFGGKPILFQPYNSTSTSATATCIATSGDYVYAGLTTPRVVANNYGSTRGNATIQTVVQTLPAPYQFSYIRVTLKEPLTTGQEVRVSMNDAGGKTILSDVGKSYATYSGLRSIKFDKVSGTNTVHYFDNFKLTISVIGGAIVDRVAVYAIPLDDDKQGI